MAETRKFVYIPDLSHARASRPASAGKGNDRVRPYDQLHIRLFDTRSLPIDERWNAANVCSTFWRLYVNDQPGASLLLAEDSGEQAWAIPPRRVVLVPAWVRFSCANRRELRHRFVHFEVMGLPAPLTRELFDRPLVLPDRSEQTRRTVEAIDAASDRHDPAAALATEAVTAEAVAIALGDRRSHARLLRWLEGGARTRPAVEHIETHLAGDLGNEALAAVCGMSEGHFARVFREELGQTPARFVLDRRIAHAAQRLVFTDDTIDAIAADAGFADRFHFSRAFARRMGLPPARYRKSERV